MKLELHQDVVPSSLADELDFNAYLARFNMDLPLIPHVILRPFDSRTGKQHFLELQTLEKQIDMGKLDLELLISTCKKLPFIEYIVSAIKTMGLEQYHLLPLGTFLTHSLTLEEQEKDFPLSEASCCKKWLAELQNFTESSFGEIKLTEAELHLKNTINSLEQQREQALQQYEKDIFQTTTLKMIYPYQKEILPEQLTDAIKNSPLLKCTPIDDSILLDYNLPETLAQLVASQESNATAMEQSVRVRLKRLNTFFENELEQFTSYCEQRKKRAFQLLLIWYKKKNKLCFPLFSEKFQCSLELAHLPALFSKNEARYIPLSIDLNQGVNLLYGANMAGKTTVLKTLFFNLTLIQVGLPIPAQKAELYFPHQVSLHLQSSGSTKSQLSSFGEELNFFSQKFSAGSYILADELFQSTNPISGIELSGVIIEEFAAADVIFFACSHHIEVFKNKQISLYRMKDVKLPEKSTTLSIENLIDKTPYQVERIEYRQLRQALEESKKPLYIALHFPLSESIKKRIQQRLKG